MRWCGGAAVWLRGCVGVWLHGTEAWAGEGGGNSGNKVTTRRQLTVCRALLRLKGKAV